ncbi:MAG: CRTAC1 family protein [Sneathiella sp.]
MFKKIAIFIGGFATLMAMGVVGMSYMKAYSDPYGDAEFAGTAVPKFTEVNFPFSHQFDEKNSLPFLGSAIIDVDGDGTPEVFMGGGYNQPDQILEFIGQGFVDASTTKGKGLVKSDMDATFGAAVIDVDGDGRSDLFVARDSGITLHLNTTSGFESRKLNIPFNDKSVPLSIALSDLNHDGYPDMFVSTYIKLALVEGQNIFNKEGYGSNSLLLLNNGNNTFTNITVSAGMEYVHNTFVSMFSDVDRDGDQDLVVAYDTGQVRTWRNNGNLTFDSTENPSSNQFGYPMGIAIGDVNNDARMDFFFSNVSSTPPRFLARGDLRDEQTFHTPLMLFKNEGDFKFTDIADQVKVADYEFSWGVVLEDLNNDGLEDILIAQNYVSLPLQKLFRLPGRVLLQLADGTFGSAEDETGLTNRNYEITPLIADFNGDGYRDVIRVNLNGQSRAFLNEGGENTFLKVQLPDTPRSLGALVEVILPGDKKLTQQFTSGEGMSSDQSHELIFGLGNAKSIERITVYYANGTMRTVSPPAVRTTLKIQ